MADVSSIVQRAYYIAGLQSKKAGDTITLGQEIDGLETLNRILDSRKLQLAFSSFLYTIAIPNLNTGLVYIGRNITGGANITVVDNAPFKVIFGASMDIPNNRISLNIKALQTLDQIPVTLTIGTPNYLYYAPQLQNNNLYTHCLLQPQPTNNPVTLYISGLAAYEDAALPITQIQTTFIEYLTYRLAKELANEGGTRDLWDKRGYEQDLKDYERLIYVNAPIDATPNDISILGERSYINNYPWN